MLSLRALLLALPTAANLIAGGSTSAMADGHAPQTTSYQNATISRMMSAHPGGERINASAVTWSNGEVTMQVPAVRWRSGRAPAVARTSVPGPV